MNPAKLLLIDADVLIDLGLKPIDPSLEQLVEAGMHRGALSFTDHLSLVLARDRRLICVTNDRRLSRACSNEGVEILWDLELMVQLVKKRRLGQLAAMKIAKRIHLSNPHHVGKSILRRFELRLRDLERGREQ